MKWFKHISDSLDDPFISTLIEKFGALGYLVFFGTLEIYAREFKMESCLKSDESLSKVCSNCVITLSYLCRKSVQTRKKRVREVLTFIHNSGKWEVIFNGDEISIKVPKFIELLDNTTIDKIRNNPKSLPSNFQVTSKQLPSKEEEEDKEEDIKKETKKKTSVPLKKVFGNHVFLTEPEHQKLIDNFGKIQTNELIENMNTYAEQIGVQKFKAKYASHYATVLNWAKRDGIQKQERKQETKKEPETDWDTIRTKIRNDNPKINEWFDGIKLQLKEEINGKSFNAFIHTLVALSGSRTKKELVLFHDTFSAGWVNEHYKGMIEAKTGCKIKIVSEV